METIGTLKMNRELANSKLMTECGVFFAFSDQQFAENKTPLQQGEKYVRLGAGGFVPKSKVDLFLDGLEINRKAYEQAIQEPKLRRANIAYELSNHEAYYTGEIESALEALGSDYTKEEVYAVFREEAQKRND